MYRLTFLIVTLIIGFSGAAHAQYIDEKPQGPMFGGPGDYVYPVICRNCTIWQDYRNFAWNQLDIHGGYAHTPSQPNNSTTFLIYTHRTNDLYPTIVDITPEVVDIEVMSSSVGYTIAEPEHFFVHTHPDNGDKVRVNFYSENMRKLMFPYEPPRSGRRSNQNRSSRRGGGDSSGGNRAGWGNGRLGGTGIRGLYAGNAGGNFCGIGTDYICIQF